MLPKLSLKIPEFDLFVQLWYARSFLEGMFSTKLSCWKVHCDPKRSCDFLFCTALWRCFVSSKHSELLFLAIV